MQPPKSTIPYSLIILVAVLGSYLYTIHSQSIFACPATGYSADRYLAYCHAIHYGDYEHGSFWFDLEPIVRESAMTADVLLLGDSRMQFGFSGDPTNEWFSSIAARYYLMGFAYWENYVFEKELLGKWRPAAKVYVINIDTFFEEAETPPAKIVMHDSDANDHYLRKQKWQRLHREICTSFSKACGNDQAFFRSRKTGAYLLKGGHIGSFPVSYNETVNQKKVSDYTARGAAFFANVPVDRACVLFTIVPTSDTSIGTAKAIARSLGVALVAPELEGLATFDQSHIDSPSAERWSRAFFESAGPQIQRCLGKSIVAHL